MTKWRPASNGSGPRHWFVMRRPRQGKPAAYHQATNGRIIRYGSFETAQAKADELNQHTPDTDALEEKLDTSTPLG